MLIFSRVTLKVPFSSLTQSSLLSTINLESIILLCGVSSTVKKPKVQQLFYDIYVVIVLDHLNGLPLELKNKLLVVHGATFTVMRVLFLLSWCKLGVTLAFSVFQASLFFFFFLEIDCCR